MNSIKFYDKFIISSYFISNFKLKSDFEIKKLKLLKLRITFKNLSKLNYISTYLSFSILTKTKPCFIKGLKNYKENRTELKGLNFSLNNKKYEFLKDFIEVLILDNRDSLRRLNNVPSLMDTLNLEKYLESIYTDKIYELSNLVRNTNQINLEISFFNSKMSILQRTFLLNILISQNILPKLIK